VRGGLKQIAKREKITVQDLVARIDCGRQDAKLSTAIRIFAVNHYRSLGLPGIIPLPLVQPDTLGSAQKKGAALMRRHATCFTTGAGDLYFEQAIISPCDCRNSSPYSVVV
jgi:Ribbon-helix-helix domain